MQPNKPRQAVCFTRTAEPTRWHSAREPGRPQSAAALPRRAGHRLLTSPPGRTRAPRKITLKTPPQHRQGVKRPRTGSERQTATGTGAQTDGPPRAGQRPQPAWRHRHAPNMAPSSPATPLKAPKAPARCPIPSANGGAAAARAANRRGARAGLRHGGRARREWRVGGRGRGAVAARGDPAAVPGTRGRAGRGGAALGCVSAGRWNAAFRGAEIAHLRGHRRHRAEPERAASFPQAARGGTARSAALTARAPLCTQRRVRVRWKHRGAAARPPSFPPRRPFRWP